MNYIDIILGILIIIAAIRGFMKGFIVEVASLVALILGVWGGIHFSHFTAGYITRVFGWHSEYLWLVSFFITLLVIIVLVHILGKILDKLVEAMALGFLNHAAGLVFGIIKAVFILSILLVFFDKADTTNHIIPRKDKEKSQVYEPIKSFVPTIFPFLNFWDDNTPADNEKHKGEKLV